jgi:hypothetical protein
MDLSKITTIFSGGLSIVYKWLAIGGIILSLMVGSYFYGHHVGAQSQETKQAKQDVKDEAKVVTIVQIQKVIDTNAVDTLQKQLDSERNKTLELQTKLSSMSEQQLQVIKPATSTTPVQCVLSKDWVDQYNASIKGATP